MAFSLRGVRAKWLRIPESTSCHQINWTPMKTVFTQILTPWKIQPRLFNRTWIRTTYMITSSDKRAWNSLLSTQHQPTATSRRRAKTRWSRGFYRRGSPARLNSIRWVRWAEKIWIITILKMHFRRKNLSNQLLTTWFSLRAETSTSRTNMTSLFTIMCSITTLSRCTAMTSTRDSSSRVRPSTKMR